MGGLSKYLINGHKATQQSVQNLFQSVQLNINNPNFLIMQGKITKVLNMKPQEILSMIEEAAGTRMFEDRKEKAFRTMNKKDMKVKEITAVSSRERCREFGVILETRGLLNYLASFSIQLPLADLGRRNHSQVRQAPRREALFPRIPEGFYRIGTSN